MSEVVSTLGHTVCRHPLAQKLGEWSCQPIPTLKIFKDRLLAGEGNHLLAYNISDPDYIQQRLAIKVFDTPEQMITDFDVLETSDEYWVMVIAGSSCRRLIF